MRRRRAGHRPRPLRPLGSAGSSCASPAASRATAARPATSSGRRAATACRPRASARSPRRCATADALHHALELQPFRGAGGLRRRAASISTIPRSGARRIDMAELDQAFTGVVLTMEPHRSVRENGQERRRDCGCCCANCAAQSRPVGLLVRASASRWSCPALWSRDFPRSSSTIF